MGILETCIRYGGAKMQQYKTYPQIRTFAIENHTSPQSVRLRSASRGGSSGTWYVYSGGYVSYYTANWAFSLRSGLLALLIE